MSLAAFAVPWDRVCSAEQTLMRVHRLTAHYGITRVPNQTGLDTIGLPCFAAIRPNALNLATSQGKGLTQDAARASAVMEAIEYAVAEAPERPSYEATIDELASLGKAWCSPQPFLPSGSEIDIKARVTWLDGYGISTGTEIAVPLDLVSLSGVAHDFPGICQTTNGLAAGNVEAEAVFHGLCELIERDAHTLWLAGSEARRRFSRISTNGEQDPSFGLGAMIQQNGLELHLFDQTSDLGVPVVMAVIVQRGGAGRKFQMAAGYGAHPLAARAAIRAITEAAQTRITSIASARDDLTADDFQDEISDDLLSLLGTRSDGGSLPRDLCGFSDPKAMTRTMVERMLANNLPEPIVVRLSSKSSPVSVVRMLGLGLEDAEANLNWRPGDRARNAASE